MALMNKKSLEGDPWVSWWLLKTVLMMLVLMQMLRLVVVWPMFYQSLNRWKQFEREREREGYAVDCKSRHEQGLKVQCDASMNE